MCGTGIRAKGRVGSELAGGVVADLAPFCGLCRRAVGNGLGLTCEQVGVSTELQHVAAEHVVEQAAAPHRHRPKQRSEGGLLAGAR